MPSRLVFEVDLNVSGIKYVMDRCHLWLSDWPHITIYFGLGVFCYRMAFSGKRIVLIYATRSGEQVEVNTYEVGTYVPPGSPKTPKFLEVPVKLLFKGDPKYDESDEVLQFDLEEWIADVKLILRLE